MSEPRLERDKKGLYLTDGELILKADFGEMKDRIRQANLERELVVKAVSVKGLKDGLKVMDATAGLGEDSFLLAASGYEVFMYEQDEVIAALLEDAVLRAQSGEDPEIPENVRIAAERMHFTKGDSIDAMLAMGGKDERSFDVIYLDPMFPERKKSAAVKKKFQLLHKLERPEMREEELLKAAISVNPRKIVIKRPIKGPFLCGIKPEYSIKGNSVRYDIVIPR